MIRLATVFSGIGAIEHALDRMGLEHKLVFACDNGDILIDVDTDKELLKIKKMRVQQNLEMLRYLRLKVNILHF
mgnify:CR=1 FL=1